MQKTGEAFVSAAQKKDLEAMQGMLEDFRRGGESSVCELLDYGRPRSGDRAAHLAARHGHRPVLGLLAAEGAYLEAANLDGKRPLHEAALAGDAGCTELLLAAGVPVDPLKRADWTPLHLACTKTDVDVVRLLIQYRANLRLRNKDGWNAFHIAAREGHVIILNCLLDHEPNLWDTVSKNGRTPLHTAAMHGRQEAVELCLTRAGYPVDQADSCGSTPLIDSLRGDFVDVAEILIQRHRADVHKCDVLGRSAIHLAAQTGCQLSVQFLLRRQGVTVDTPTGIGANTALHLATKEGHVAMIETLHSMGANLNATDERGRTALHVAAGIQHGACVRTLLTLGALDCQDRNGLRPSQLATKKDILELFEGT